MQDTTALQVLLAAALLLRTRYLLVVLGTGKKKNMIYPERGIYCFELLLVVDLPTAADHVRNICSCPFFSFRPILAAALLFELLP